ncbi:MAG: translocation/assembly module TamB domain-containing protein [Gemmatimonadota bacterium]|nr:translocation/assembly module TamB domain-containing protein [Gemmatimonadota bacterium]
MARRLLLGAVMVVAWLAAMVSGTASAALRTQAGRQVLVDWAVATANARISGSLTVGTVGGSFFRGLEVSDLAVRGPTGDSILTAELVGIQYRVRDLLSGSIVFGELRLRRPQMLVMQVESGGPINLTELFSTGKDETGGPRPLIAFNDVEIEDGRVVVKTPVTSSGPPLVEREPGPHGDLQVRRFEQLDAELANLRVSSPVPGAPLRVEVDRLRSAVSDPRLTVRDLRGTIRLWSDSVAVDIDRIVLPETRAELDGTVRWGDGALLFDLRGRTESGLTDDVRTVVPALPAGLRGAASFAVRSLDSTVLAVSGERLDVRGAGGGELRGRLGMVLGPGERWAFDRTDLELEQFDLEYARGFLDTLPFAGRVSGRVAADGPAERLDLDLDAVLFDHLVPDRPPSSVLGSGIVSVTADDFVFDAFEVEQADISLATVRRVAPSVALEGRVWASGTLDGSWLNATFDGNVRYADPPGAESSARGSIRLDTRSDTVGVWADLTLDSLRFESFHSSLDGFDLAGSWGGTLRLAGHADSLEVEADVAGPVGTIRALGALYAGTDRLGVHALEVEARQLDLGSLSTSFPTTLLQGRLVGRGSLEVGSVRAEAEMVLDSSSVGGVNVERVIAGIGLTPTRLEFDSLQVGGFGFEVTAIGAIALEPNARDTITFLAVSDSIGALEPFVARWLGVIEDSVGTEVPTGSLRFTGRVIGSLEAYQVVADAQLSEIRRGDVYVSRGGGTVTWVTSTETIGLDATVDSVALGAMSLSRLSGRLHGRVDSLRWFGRSRLGRGAWIGWGEWLASDSLSTLNLDSLVLSLASGPWVLDTAATVMVDDSGLVFTSVSLQNAQGPGRVAVNGRWAFRGGTAIRGTVDGLMVSDVLLVLLQDPELASGELGGTLSLQGTARAPVIEFMLSLRDGMYRDFRAPYTQGVLRYRDRRVTGDLELRRQGQSILNLSASLPMDLALSGAGQRRLPGPLQITARAEGVGLELFEAITPAVRDLGGTLDATVGIEGTWESPELAGDLSVRDGAATFPALGVRHEQLNGTLRLSGDTILLRELSVRSGRGIAQASGFVRLEELSRPVLRIGITAQEFRAIDVRDFLALTASGDVQLRGPLYGATLTGRATATRGNLYFADLLRKDIVNLEDTLFAEFVDTSLIRRQGLRAQLQSRFLDSLRIDSVQVTLGSDFWLRSSEANVQLAGAVSVNKVRDRYRLDGLLEAPRGTYRLQLGLGNTREFAVTQGQIRYLGTPDLNADLDIDAQHSVRTTLGEDVRVFVNIGGTLYDPRLTLTSDIRPALSEPEILGYLLFGAPTLEAGASQRGFESRLVTQQVFGALSGQIEYSLISDMGVPLDYLQIRPTTSRGGLSGAEIAVGKQFDVFGTTAFLSASPRICGREALRFGAVGAGLEFRLNKQWLVSASVDPLRSCEIGSTSSVASYQFGADLFWEKRY